MKIISQTSGSFMFFVPFILGRGEVCAIKRQKYALLLISLSIINCYGPSHYGCLRGMSAQYFMGVLSIADRKCRQNRLFFHILCLPRFEYLSRPTGSQDSFHVFPPNNHLLGRRRTTTTTSPSRWLECI